MIQAKKIPDLSKSQQIEIVSLNMDKIDGCEFNLNSEEPVSFTDKNLELELVESKNNSNIVKARCNTEKKNIKEIQCEINDNLDNDYSLKDEIISESNKFININSTNKFKILCDKNNHNKKKIIIAVSVVGSCVLLISSIIIIYCICKNKKRTDKDILKNHHKNSHRKKNKNKNNNNDEEVIHTSQYLTIKENNKGKKAKKNNERDKKKSKK